MNDNLALVGTFRIEDKRTEIHLDKGIKDAFENIELLAKLMEYNVIQTMGRFMYEVSVEFEFNKNNESKFCITFKYINHSYKCLLEQMCIVTYNDEIDMDIDLDYEEDVLTQSYSEKEEIIRAINDFANLL